MEMSRFFRLNPAALDGSAFFEIFIKNSSSLIISTTLILLLNCSITTTSYCKYSKFRSTNSTTVVTYFSWNRNFVQ